MKNIGNIIAKNRKKGITKTFSVILVLFVTLSSVSQILCETGLYSTNEYYFVHDILFENEEYKGWMGNSLSTKYNCLILSDDKFTKKSVDISLWNGYSPLLLTVLTNTETSDSINKIRIYDSNTSQLIYEETNFNSLRSVRIDYYIFPNVDFVTIEIIDNDENLYDVSVKEVSLYTSALHQVDLLTKETLSEDIYPLARGLTSEIGYVTGEYLGHNARVVKTNGIQASWKEMSFYFCVPSVYNPTLSYLFSSFTESLNTTFKIEFDIFDLDNRGGYINIVSEYEYVDGYPAVNNIDLSEFAGHYVNLIIKLSWWDNIDLTDNGLILHYLFIDGEIFDDYYTPGETIQAEDYSKSLYNSIVKEVDDFVYDESYGYSSYNNPTLMIDNNIDGGYVSYLIQNTIPVYTSSFETYDLDNWEYNENFTHISDGVLKTDTLSDYWNTNAHLNEEFNDSYIATFEFKIIDYTDLFQSIFGIWFNYNNQTNDGYLLEFGIGGSNDGFIKLCRKNNGATTILYERQETITKNFVYTVSIIYSEYSISILIPNSESINLIDTSFNKGYIGIYSQYIDVNVNNIEIEMKDDFAADRLHLRAMNAGPEDVEVVFYIDNIDGTGLSRRLIAKMNIEHGKGLNQYITPINPEYLNFRAILTIEIITPFIWPIYLDTIGFTGATPFGNSRFAWDYYRRGTATYIDHDMLIYAGDEPSGYVSLFDYTDSTNEIYYPKFSTQTWQTVYNDYCGEIASNITNFGDWEGAPTGETQLSFDFNKTSIETYGSKIYIDFNVAGDVKIEITFTAQEISSSDIIQLGLVNDEDETFLAAGRKGNRYYILVDGYERYIQDTTSFSGGQFTFKLTKTNDSLKFETSGTTIFEVVLDEPSLYQQSKMMEIILGTEDGFSIAVGAVTASYKNGYTILRHRVFEERFNDNLSQWSLNTQNNDNVTLSNSQLIPSFDYGTGWHGIELTHEEAFSPNLIIEYGFDVLQEYPAFKGKQTFILSSGGNDVISITLQDADENSKATYLMIHHGETIVYQNIIENKILNYVVRIVKEEYDCKISLYDRDSWSDLVTIDLSFSELIFDEIKLKQTAYENTPYIDAYVNDLIIDEYYYKMGYETSSINTIFNDDLYPAWLSGIWEETYTNCAETDFSISNKDDLLYIIPTNPSLTTANVTFTRNLNASDTDFTIDILMSAIANLNTGQFRLLLNDETLKLTVVFSGTNMIFTLESNTDTSTITLDKTILNYNTLRITKSGTSVVLYSDILHLYSLEPMISISSNSEAINNIKLEITTNPSNNPITFAFGNVVFSDSAANAYLSPWSDGHIIINDHFQTLNWDVNGIGYYTNSYSLIDGTKLLTDFGVNKSNWYGNTYSYKHSFQRDFYFDIRLSFLLDGSEGIISLVLENSIRHHNLFQLDIISTSQSSIEIILLIDGIKQDTYVTSQKLDQNVFRIERIGNTLSIYSDISSNQLNKIFEYTNEIENINIDRIKLKQLAKSYTAHTMLIDAIYLNARNMPVSNPVPPITVAEFVPRIYETDFVIMDDFSTHTYGETSTDDVPFSHSGGLKTLFNFNTPSEGLRGRSYFKDIICVEDFILSFKPLVDLEYNNIGILKIELLDNSYQTVFTILMVFNDTLQVDIYLYDKLVLSYEDDGITEVNKWFRFARKGDNLLFAICRGDYFIPVSETFDYDLESLPSLHSDIFGLRITQAAPYTGIITPNEFIISNIMINTAQQDETGLLSREIPTEQNFIASYDMWIEEETKLSITALSNYYSFENITERLQLLVYLLPIGESFDINSAYFVGGIIFLDNDIDTYTHSLMIIGYNGLFEVIICIDRMIPISLYMLETGYPQSWAEAEEDYVYSSDMFGWEEEFEGYLSPTGWDESVWTKEIFLSQQTLSSSLWTASGMEIQFSNNLMIIDHTTTQTCQATLHIPPLNVSNYPFFSFDIMTEEKFPEGTIYLVIENMTFDITPNIDTTLGFVSIKKNLYEILYPFTNNLLGEITIKVTSPCKIFLRNFMIYKIYGYNYLHYDDSSVVSTVDSIADVGVHYSTNTILTFLLGSHCTPERYAEEQDFVTMIQSLYEVPVISFDSDDPEFIQWFNNSININKQVILTIFDEIPTKLIEEYYIYDHFGRPFITTLLEEWQYVGNYLLWVGTEPFMRGVDEDGSLHLLTYDDYKKFSGRLIDSAQIGGSVAINISSFGMDIGMDQYEATWLVNASSLPSSIGEWVGGYVNLEGVEYNETEHGDLIITNPLMFYENWLSTFIGYGYGFMAQTDITIFMCLLDKVFIPPTDDDVIFGNLLLRGPIKLEKEFSFTNPYKFMFVGTSDKVIFEIESQNISFVTSDVIELNKYDIQQISGYSIVVNETMMVSIDEISFITENIDTSPHIFNFDEPDKLEYDHNFVPTYGDFMYSNNDYVLVQNSSTGYSSAYLNTQSYGDCVIQLEMGVYPRNYYNSTAGIMINIPESDPDNLFFDSIFVGFTVKGYSYDDWTYPVSLIVARYYSDSSYDILYLNEITKLGNSFDGNKDIIVPLKLTIVKTFSETGISLNIFAKTYRTYPRYGIEELLEIQYLDDGIYECHNGWFGDNSKIDYDMRSKGQIGLYANNTNFTYNYLSISPLLANDSGDYVNLNSGSSHVSSDGLWLDGTIETPYQDNTDTNFIISILNPQQNIVSFDKEKYIKIAIENNLGQEREIIFSRYGWGTYVDDHLYSLDFFGYRTVDAFYEINPNEYDKPYFVAVSVNHGDVIFTVWKAGDYEHRETKYYTGMFGMDSVADVRLSISTVNSLAYIDYISNGKMQASDLVYAYGRGLWGAGEVSYWLKGDSKYSLLLDESSISSTYTMYNATLNIFNALFLMNGTTDASFISSYNSLNLFNISIIDNYLYFNNSYLDFIFLNEHFYDLSYSFNQTHQELTIIDTTKNSQEPISWSFTENTTLIEGYLYDIEISATKGMLFLAEVIIDTLNSYFTTCNMDNWVYDTQLNEPLFSNEYSNTTCYLQVFANPLLGPTKITVYGDGQLIGEKMVKYSPMASFHPILISLQNFDTVGLHLYTLHFDNLIELDRLALGESIPITDWLYTAPDEDVDELIDSIYKIDFNSPEEYIISIVNDETMGNVTELFNGDNYCDFILDIKPATALEIYYKIPNGDSIIISIPTLAMYINDYNYDSRNLLIELVLSGDSSLDKQIYTEGFNDYQLVRIYDTIVDDDSWHHYQSLFTTYLQYVEYLPVGESKLIDLLTELDASEPMALVKNCYTIAKYTSFGSYPLSITANTGSSIFVDNFALYVPPAAVWPSEDLESVSMPVASHWKEISANNLGRIDFTDLFNIYPGNDTSFYLSFTTKTVSECYGSLVINTNMEFELLIPTMYSYQPPILGEYDSVIHILPIHVYGGLSRFIFRVMNHGMQNISLDTTLFFQVDVILDHVFLPQLNSIELQRDELNNTFIPEYVVSTPSTWIDMEGEWAPNGSPWINFYDNNSMSFGIYDFLQRAVPLPGDILVNNVSKAEVYFERSKINEYGNIMSLGDIEEYDNNSQILCTFYLYLLADIVDPYSFILHSNLNIDQLAAIFVDGVAIHYPTAYNGTSFDTLLPITDTNDKFKLEIMGEPYSIYDSYLGDTFNTSWHRKGFHSFSFFLNRINSETLNFSISIEGLTDAIIPFAGPTDYSLDLSEKLSQNRLYLVLDEYKGGLNIPYSSTTDVARRPYTSKDYLYSSVNYDGFMFHVTRMVWIGVADYDDTDKVGYVVAAIIYDQSTNHEAQEIYIQKVEVQSTAPCGLETNSLAKMKSLGLESSTYNSHILGYTEIFVSQAVNTITGESSNVLTLQESDFNIQSIGSSMNIELQNVVDIEIWDVGKQHVHLGIKDSFTITIKNGSFTDFSGSQMRITLHNRVITINLLTKQLHILYGSNALAYEIGKASISVSSSYGDAILSSTGLFIITDITVDDVDSRPLSPSQTLSKACITLSEYLTSIDYFGAFIALSKSLYRQLHDFIQREVLCPIKQVFNAFKFIFNELFTPNSTFWQNIWEHKDAYAIMAGLMFVTYLVGFVVCPYLATVGLPFMGMIGSAFVIGLWIEGALFVGMIVLDMLNYPNFIAEGLTYQFQVMIDKIVAWFSDAWKFITTTFNVLFSHELSFNNKMAYLKGVAERSWQSVSGFFQNIWKKLTIAWKAIAGWAKAGVKSMSGDADTQLAILRKFTFLLFWVLTIGGCTGGSSVYEYPFVNSNTDELLHLNYRAHNVEFVDEHFGSHEWQVGEENAFMALLVNFARLYVQKEQGNGNYEIGFYDDEHWESNDTRVAAAAELLRNLGFVVSISETVGANTSSIYVPFTKNNSSNYLPDGTVRESDIVIYKVYDDESNPDSTWHYEWFMGLSDNAILPGGFGLGMGESTFMGVMEMFLAKFDIIALWQDIRDMFLDPDDFYRRLAMAQIPGDIAALVSRGPDPIAEAQNVLQQQLKDGQAWRKYMGQVTEDMKDLGLSPKLSVPVHPQRKIVRDGFETISDVWENNKNIQKTIRNRKLYSLLTASAVMQFLNWGIFLPQMLYQKVLGGVMGLPEALVMTGLQLFCKMRPLSKTKLARIVSGMDPQKLRGNNAWKLGQSFGHTFWFHNVMEWMYDLQDISELESILPTLGIEIEDWDHYVPPPNYKFSLNTDVPTDGSIEIENYKVNPVDESEPKRPTYKELFKESICERERLNFYLQYLRSVTSRGIIYDETYIQELRDTVKKGDITKEWMSAHERYWEDSGTKPEDELLNIWIMKDTTSKQSSFITTSDGRVLIPLDKIIPGNVPVNNFIKWSSAEDYENTPLFDMLYIIKKAQDLEQVITDDFLNNVGQKVSMKEFGKWVESEQAGYKDFIEWVKKSKKYNTNDIYKIGFRNLVQEMMNLYYEFRFEHTGSKEKIHFASTFYRDMMVLQEPLLKQQMMEKVEHTIHDRAEKDLPSNDLISPWLRAVVDENGKVTDIIPSFEVDGTGRVTTESLKWLFEKTDDQKYHGEKQGKDAFIAGKKLIPTYHYNSETHKTTITYEQIDVMINVEAKCYSGEYSISDLTGTKNTIFVNELSLDAQSFLRHAGIIYGVTEKNELFVKQYSTPNGGTLNTKNIIGTVQREYDVFPGKNNRWTVADLIVALDAKNADAGYNIIQHLQKQAIISDLTAFAQGELAPIRDENGFIIEYDSGGTPSDYRLHLSHSSDNLGTNIDMIKYRAHTEVYSIRLPGTTTEITEVEFDGKTSSINLHAESFVRSNNPTHRNVLEFKSKDGTKYQVTPAIFYAEESGKYYTFKQDGSVWLADSAQNLRAQIIDELKTVLDINMENNLPAISSVAKQYMAINEQFERQMITGLINGLTNGYYDNVNTRRGWELNLFETVHKAHSDLDYSPNVDTHTSLLLQRQTNENGMFETPQSSRRTRAELLYGANAFTDYTSSVGRYSTTDKMLMNVQGSLDFDSEMDQMLGEKITISTKNIDSENTHMRTTNKRFQDQIKKLEEMGKINNLVSAVSSTVLLIRLAETTLYAGGSTQCIVVRNSQGNIMQFLEISKRKIGEEDRICLDDLISHMSQMTKSNAPKVYTSNEEYIQTEGTNIIKLEYLKEYNKGGTLDQYIINAIENIETKSISFGNDGEMPFDTPFRTQTEEGSPTRLGWSIPGARRLLKYALLKDEIPRRCKFGPYYFNKENAHEKIKQTYDIYKGTLTPQELTVRDILDNEIELKGALQIYLSNKRYYSEGKYISNTDQIKTIKEMIDIIVEIMRMGQHGYTFGRGPDSILNELEYKKLANILIAPFISRIYDAITNGGQWRPVSRSIMEQEFGKDVIVWKDDTPLFVKLATNKESIAIEYYRQTVRQASTQKKLSYAEYIDEKIKDTAKDTTEYNILKAIQLALNPFATVPNRLIRKDANGREIGFVVSETAKFYHVLYELVRSEKQLKAINDNTTPWNKFELWTGMALVNAWESLREIGARASISDKFNAMSKMFDDFQSTFGTNKNALSNARWIISWVNVQEFMKQWDRISRK